MRAPYAMRARRNVAVEDGERRKILDVDVAADLVVVLDIEPDELRVAPRGRNALERFAEFAARVAPGRAQRDYDQRAICAPA